MVVLGSCAADFDDVGPDAAVAEGIAGDGLDLWTPIAAPPYDAAERSRARRVLELEPDGPGDITLVTALRWRDSAAGAVSPLVSVALAGAGSESTLLQIFESDGGLRARADLEMTDALEVGVWYRVTLTIADAPGRPVQVRIADADGVEVWRSCGGEAARCPSAPIDAGDLDALRLNVTVDDLRGGEGIVQLRDTWILQNP